MPHNGSAFPDDLKSQFLPNAFESHDTDWFLDRLYAFAKDLGCSIINPHYSRYVIDLNRAADGSELYPGADNTELCPTSAFDWSALYPAGGEPSEEVITSRIENYWKPYHSALNSEIIRLRQQFPEVILFEAHSIASRVKRFFPDKLNDFNFGNNDGKSSSQTFLDNLQNGLNLEPYSCVFNGRFKGGYITRNYGNPNKGIHSIQLELSQDTYMNEETLEWDDAKATQVIPKLNSIIDLLVQNTGS
jgi:N-formylglutamate deformylase